jgi:hypothetical protein
VITTPLASTRNYPCSTEQHASTDRARIFRFG